MLKCVNLSSGYGKLQVVKSVSMNVQKNEVVAMIGGNGAGKSTFLKTIAGVIRPTEGHVFLESLPIKVKRPEQMVRLGIVLVPENRGLFPGMTITENLKMGANAAFTSKKSFAERLDGVYTLFGELKNRTTAKAGELSGGQQQMLAVGKALMSDPKLLVLDEPSTGLAPILVQELFAKIATLKDSGMTILLAEQNVQTALDVADRAYVIENGRIVLDGDSEELKCSSEVQKAYLGI